MKTKSSFRLTPGILRVATTAVLLTTVIATAGPLRLSRAEYEDRVQAVWTAQIIAVLLGFPFEHQVASTVWVDQYPKPYGYAEAVDGAEFMVGMVSLGFVETDPKAIVRQAARLIHPDSPYRKCLDLVIVLAEAGRTPQEIADAVEERWHIEYPATNNAVPNGGLVAVGVWFGEGDFLKTVNLIYRAADFTDADCNAANAAAVVAAMRGLKCLPAPLVAALQDRIRGEKMGPVTLTPAVDETISELAKRTAAIGEKFLLAHGVKLEGETISGPAHEPVTQPAKLFQLDDLMRYWNPDWNLERAGFGGAGGGMGGIRGITCLEGEVLVPNRVAGNVYWKKIEIK